MWSKDQASYIHDGVINRAIERWQDKQPDRTATVATPSRLTTCPRVVWRTKEGVEPTNPMTWALKQRLLLGRTFENQIAEQLEEELLYHWKDDAEGESVKFSMGEGVYKVEGTPDLLLQLDKVSISDAKTGRSDGYGYVATDNKV